MRKYRVCTWLSNTLLELGKLERALENPRLFNITLEDGQKADEQTFRNIILQKKPDLLKYPGGGEHSPDSTMKILSWSLVEE